MRRLQAMSKMTGGRQLAADVIEKTYVTGSSHLTDNYLLKMSRKYSFCQFFWFRVFLVALICLYIYLAIEYYR